MRTETFTEFITSAVMIVTLSAGATLTPTHVEHAPTCIHLLISSLGMTKQCTSNKLHHTKTATTVTYKKNYYI